MKHILITIILLISINGYSQTITTSAPLQTSLCAGGNIVVEYQTTGSFNIGCTFTAELSDAWGNFTNPVPIGSMPINTGVILGTIPSNTTFGFNYRVRVVSDNPSVIGTESPNPPLIITSTAVSATIIADPGTEVCEGTSINLWVTPNESYFWSTGETTQSIDVTTSGTYNVTVTNYLTGCEVSSTPINVTVNPLPDIDLGPDISFCEGSSTLLDAGAGYSNYSWNNGTSSNQSILVDTSGTWQVLVTDTNGCSKRDTITIVVNPNPTLDLGSDTVFCGNHYLLNAGAGFVSYNWNNGLSFNPTFDVIQPGTYFVVISDQNQCTATDTVTVDLNQPPTINLGNDLTICGNSAVLNAGSGYLSYNWNNGLGTNQFLPVVQSGNYYIDVTASNNCHGYDTIFVSLNQLPDVNLGSDFQLLTNDSIVLDAGSGYSFYNWNNGSTNQTLEINGWDYLPGIYTFSVTVIDSVGCFNSDYINVTIIESSGVNELALETYSIYPNPFYRTFKIDFYQSIPEGIPVLTDILGNSIYPEYEYSNNGWIIRCNGIAKGIYFLTIVQSELNIHLGKVISR